MNTICIIPARGGSKRLPGKNILPLAGLPLIAHSIQYALRHRDLVGEVIVSTDDDAIAAVAADFGARVIGRPAHLSGDHEPTVTALQHVLQSVPAQRVVLLQPTNPLRPDGLLEDAIRMANQKNCDVFTVSRSHHKLGTIQNDRFVPYNYTPGQRSQDLEPLFYENGLLYICSADAIARGAVITPQAFPLVTDHPFADVDIDTADDFSYAEYLINKNK